MILICVAVHIGLVMVNKVGATVVVAVVDIVVVVVENVVVVALFALTHHIILS